MLETNNGGGAPSAQGATVDDPAAQAEGEGAGQRAGSALGAAEIVGKRQRKPTQLFAEAGELSDDDNDWDRRRAR